MDFITVLKLVLSKFEEGNIPYMLVGSVASSFYGDPRLTRDIDIVIEVSPKDVIEFESLFSSNDFYIPPSEILRDEILNKGSFNLIHHQSGLKIDIVIKKLSPHGEEEFLRRQKHEILPQMFSCVASAEDIILKKLQYFQEGGSQKHLMDCRAILSQTKVDELYLKKWIKYLNLQKEWDLL